MEGKAPDRTGTPHFPVDTDHGVNRSVTGWRFMLGGAAVSWAVPGQLAPALSSTEAELYGLSTVCDMLVCIYVLEEMGLVQRRSPAPGQGTHGQPGCEPHRL